MAEKLGLSNDVKEIKLGKSFMRGDNPCFHTFRYDFMPASVDTTKRATIDIGKGHQVTVTVPHIEGSGTANTVFKGSKKPYQKECVLIIDHNTGEITLEKLTNNVQLKKTRAEGSSKIRSSTPIDSSFNNKRSPAQKLSPQRKPPSFGRCSPVQKCSPLPKSPLGNQLSPNNSTVPSMPSLSMLSSQPPPAFTESIPENTPKQGTPEGPEVGVLSSSSSDSSSSDDSSDSSSSDNEEETENKPPPSMPNGLGNSFNWRENSNAASSSLSMPTAAATSSVPFSMPTAAASSAPFSMPTAPAASSSPFSMPTAAAVSSAPFSMPTALASSSAPFSMPTANSISSMPKFSQLSEDLKLSESDSDSEG